ncbi:MAG: hypothetical protein U0599_20050 [Vicinamibacteria bacterium]
MSLAPSEPPPARPGSRERVWLLAAGALYLALAVSVVSTRTYWPRYDSAVYVSGATAIARGVGLRDITSPVTRPAASWAHVPGWIRRSPALMDRADWPVYGQYPPLLPLALAPLVTLGGGRFLVLQILPLLAGLGTLGLVYRARGLLFPGPWPLTVVATAGSMLTLYATRVQTEAVHALLVVATLCLLALASREPARLGRWAAAAGLVLALGVAVHVRLVFLAAGAAAWLLVAPRAPLVRRAAAAAMFAVVTMAPPVVFTFGVSWAGRAGLPHETTSFTLTSNPYYWTDGWDPSAPQLGRADAALRLARRSTSAGRLLWNGLSAGSLYVEPDMLALTVAAGVALLAGPWWRHRGGLLALPTAAYLAGVLFSPWAESRMAVPVLPVVAHAVAVAAGRLPGLLGAHGARPGRQAVAAVGALLLSVQLANWWRLRPALDEYALEYWQHGATLALARVAAQLPSGRVVVAPVDNAAFAIVTGHPTLSTSPIEWKMSDPRVYLASGGAPVMLTGVVRKERLPDAAADPALAALAGPRSRLEIDVGGGYAVAAEWVREPPILVPADPLVPGRIHPRWMRLSPADRAPLARAAIPAAAP